MTKHQQKQFDRLKEKELNRIEREANNTRESRKGVKSPPLPDLWPDGCAYTPEQIIRAYREHGKTKRMAAQLEKMQQKGMDPAVISKFKGRMELRERERDRETWEEKESISKGYNKKLLILDDIPSLNPFRRWKENRWKKKFNEALQHKKKPTTSDILDAITLTCGSYRNSSKWEKFKYNLRRIHYYWAIFKSSLRRPK